MKARVICTILVFVLEALGIVLVIGGGITDKNGAIGIGLCLVSVAIQQLIVIKMQTKPGEK